MELPGAGRLYTKTLNFPRAAFPLDCTTAAGDERLELRLEG
jgi:hypothetical protein